VERPPSPSPWCHDSIPCYSPTLLQLQAFSNFVAPSARQLQAFNHAALTSPPHPEHRLLVAPRSRSPSSLLDARRSIPLGSGSSCAAVQADENCCL
ncbi:hypothetical protein S83_059884, partial [Arachis hypogaea]